jgi:hypothetical protein
MFFDPGLGMHLFPLLMCILLSSNFVTFSTLPHLILTRLNHFSLAAYGLQYPMPTLNPYVAISSPRLSTKCVGFTLFRRLFQPLAVRRFRGAPQTSLHSPVIKKTKCPFYIRMSALAPISDFINTHHALKAKLTINAPLLPDK